MHIRMARQLHKCGSKIMFGDDEEDCEKWVPQDLLLAEQKEVEVSGGEFSKF